MKSGLRRIALLGLKYTGCFWLARRFTARSLRILCYHGISVADEHVFRGRLFMTLDTFKARMEQLRGLRYPVISLSQALDGLRAGSLPPGAVVLTFDDGWKRACSEALPWLVERDWPVTLYVTSYHCERQTQVTNVAIQYLLWATKRDDFELAELAGRYDLTVQRGRDAARDAALAYCATLPVALDRQAFVLKLGAALGVDIASLCDQGAFMLASREELKALANRGVDLQLHTHRHTVTENGSSVLARELADNRNFLEGVARGELRHFCYPSGVYDRGMWPELSALGVVSATTCESGFNYSNTPLLGLRRILDEEALSSLEFEAELSGVLEIWKQLRRVIH